MASEKASSQTIGFHQICPYIRLVQQIRAGDSYRLPSRIIYDHELIFVLDGGCMYEIDGKEYELGPGDLLLMKPNVRHRAYVRPNERFHYYAAHFDFAYLGERYDFSVDEIYINQDYRHSAEIPEVEALTERPGVTLAEPEFPFVLSAGGGALYARCFEDMYAAYRSRHYGYELTMRAAMLQIIAGMLRELTTEAGVQLRHPQRERVHQAIQYMREHYARHVEMSEIAEAVHLSAGRFRAIFREATGKSPLAYLTDIRMEKAKQLLLERKASISRIAERVGYAEPHYFSRLFKRAEGMSPRQYAESLGKSAP